MRRPEQQAHASLLCSCTASCRASGHPLLQGNSDVYTIRMVLSGHPGLIQLTAKDAAGGPLC